MLRVDIENALDDLILHEEGMRFQGLAVVIGKQRWPEIVARHRKKDGGLDAYAPASLTVEGFGKGLAASITATRRKVLDDAETAKRNFPDLQALLFVTAGKVGNSASKEWREEVRGKHGLDLHVIEREEIVVLLSMPENAPLGATFLGLRGATEPEVDDLVARARRAGTDVVQGWRERSRGRQLIELAAVPVDRDAAEPEDLFQLDGMHTALTRGGRFVLEGPGGCGKTTALIQLAQRTRSVGVPLVVDLPAWAAIGGHVLEYVAGMPAFQAEGLTSTDLARVQKAEPLLLLLNGWNEVAESTSAFLDVGLRQLDREFPAAGIAVATRTHHLVPPLAGAMRLRLLPLRRDQRAEYLATRLGGRATALVDRIDADATLDALTRTPFVLGEVASLFEAGAAIPTSKLGILGRVLNLHAQRDEHRNHLAVAPVFNRQDEFLQALACAMTQRAAVALSEADARSEVAVVARRLESQGQLERAGAPTVLATLTAHHVLERVDYPETMFRFQHQQLQEYYAALGVRAGLQRLPDADDEATGRFLADYVNDQAWAEPLCMCAEDLAEERGDDTEDRHNASIGARLVEMALSVDLVFAGELARLCGGAVWEKVRSIVGERLRASYAMPDVEWQQHAVAAMLATGKADFHDIVTALLSGTDQQTRLSTYRLWPDIRMSSLGLDWPEKVRQWTEAARVDLVSEVLHQRIDDEVVSFAVADGSAAVKEAAVSGLMWTESENALVRVLKSMDARTFERVARRSAKDLPAALVPAAVSALREVAAGDGDWSMRLRAALDLIGLGEKRLAATVKDGLTALAGKDMRDLAWPLIRPALAYLKGVDPDWVGGWVVRRIVEGELPYGHEEWLRFATVIADDAVEEIVHRLGTGDSARIPYEGMIAVLALRADVELAARIFSKLREARRQAEEDPGKRQEVWEATRLLTAALDGLPEDVVAGGILASVRKGDTLDLRVASEVLGRGGPDAERLRVGSAARAHLRVYLKGGVDTVLGRDDYNGDEKADLAKSIARIGEPQDMPELVRLIRADIERRRRGRAARVAGDRGPLGNGGVMDCGGRHVGALVLLDAIGADAVLVDLLGEPEYVSHAAAAIASDFTPAAGPLPARGFSHEGVWAARDGPAGRGVEARRARLAAALDATIGELRKASPTGESSVWLADLAKALAALDGVGSAATVMDLIAMPQEWGEFVRLEAAERLLMAGVVLPATGVCAFVDAVVERMARWTTGSDWGFLCRVLALCPFVDDPAAGVAKMREVVGKHGLRGYRLRELFAALGGSRSEAAVDLVHELATDQDTFRSCEEEVIESLARLDTQRSRELLLGFVDPRVANRLEGPVDREDALVSRVGELAVREAQVEVRLRGVCEQDLPEASRRILSKVLCWLGSREAAFANLALIDDDRRTPVPAGVRAQLEGMLVERRSEGEEANVFTLHARASNELRARLLEMAHRDGKRRNSAVRLLGQIEVWRLEFGRPADEPRHPDLASGHVWPPTAPSAP